MKTRNLFMTVLVVLACALTAQAQSVVGNWYTGMPMEDAELEGTIALGLDIQEDKALNVTVGLEMKGEIDKGVTMKIVIGSEANGTWSQNGDQLITKLNMENVETDVHELEFNGIEQAQEDMLRPFIKSMFKEQCKSSIESIFKEFEDVSITIKSVTDDSLVLVVGEDTLTFLRDK